MRDVRLLITGGPGAGATTTGAALSKVLDIPWFDSDNFFHKPTDPPFQEQYSKQERSSLLHQSLASASSWILSGSISAWGIADVQFSHAVILNIGAQLRVTRLKQRERERFGPRILKCGDMYHEHLEFMRWAENYESGDLEGRSLPTERKFLKVSCKRVIEVERELPLPGLIKVVHQFVAG